MQILQLNQSNLLLKPFYVHKIQFIYELRPSSSSHGQLRELVFVFSHRGSHFLNVTLDYSQNQYEQSDLSSTNVLVQSLNKMHMKYVLHNKFRMIIFHDQKALSLNFKSSRSQMFFKIDVLKNLAMFTGKHLCWSYFLIQLQGWRTTILLKRDSSTSAFL